MSNQNRDTANDICKGIAILLMIVGHILSMHDYFRVWIYSFHMPLFFFLAGMTFKPKPVITLAISSAKRLLVPFITCMAISICIFLVLANYDMAIARCVGMIFPDSIKHAIFGYSNSRANAAALWFLVALFWSRIYFNGLYQISPKAYLPNALLITVLCGYFGKYCFNLPFCMLVGGCAVGYMAFGKWYSENRNLVNKVPIWMWLCFIPIWLFSAYRFYFEMYGFNYLKRAYVITMIVACVACALIYHSTEKISSTINPQWYKWLQWCGINSLVILICHFFAQEMLIAAKDVFHYSFTDLEVILWKVIGTFALVFIWFVGKKYLRRQKRKMLSCYDNWFKYKYPDSCNGWNKYSGNPILGNQMTGTLFDPFVFNENGLLRMLYSDRKDGCLVLATSKDGICWENRQTILCGVENSWEHIVNRGCLLKHGDKWQLWYTGQNHGKSSIGYAESADGKNYKRVANQPVLEAELAHEGVSVMNPCVIWDYDKKKYRMWYAAGEDYEPDVICYAESLDGIEWLKHDKPVLLPCKNHAWEKYKVGGCDVQFENGIYTMYYIGYQNINLARICYAYSNDGINWIRPTQNLLISPSKGEWDADACYKPTVISWHQTLMLYYNGRQNTTEYIGLATKKISEQ